MAITDAYATAAEYRALTEKSDTADDAEILTDLTAITRMVEAQLHRTFNKDATTSTRLYIGTGTPRLYVDDILSITSIKLDEDDDGSFADETALASTEYELHPLNAAVGAEPKPYDLIVIPPWATTRSAWDKDRRIEVIGQHGWNAIPAAIKRAVIDLTAILRIESPRATREVQELAQTVITMSPEGSRIITELRKRYYKRTF